MNTAACHIIVFAKAPVPGQVKTRLIPSLGPSGAASLHEQLVTRILSIAVDAQVGSVDLWCTPSSRHPFFRRCRRKFRVSLFDQAAGDLGFRMAHAFRETLRSASAAVLIGTDCPSLTSDELRASAEVLRKGVDAVIGPAEDGGYVLIGLRRYAPELFKEISWGTDSVLRQTQERLVGLGWKWRRLSEQWDVDRPEDVVRLKREGFPLPSFKR